MRILLAEDDRHLNDTLTYQLEQQHFTVDSCFDGEEACYLGEQNIYDVILLDRMLPGMEGTDVLTALRHKGIKSPIILITALGTLTDKVTGLDLGADDYLVKPFAFEELMARIRCVSRRPHALTVDDAFTVGDVTWQASESVLTGPAGHCTLSKKEAALMEIFLHSKGRTLPPPPPEHDLTEGLGPGQQRGGRQSGQLHPLPAPAPAEYRKQPADQDRARRRLYTDRHT